MSLTTKKEKIAKYRLRPRFFPMQINTTKNRHRKCGKSNEWHNIGTHWGNVWAQKWFFSSQLWQRIFEIAFSKLTLKWHSSVPNVYISDNNQKLYIMENKRTVRCHRFMSVFQFIQCAIMKWTPFTWLSIAFVVLVA